MQEPGDSLAARIGALTQLVDARFSEYLDLLPAGTPRHRVEFSPRITTSWALIYFRRHVVRLSPYLFLLEPEELQHATHWRELDATLRHEAAHAALFHLTGDTGHGRAFHALLQHLGVEANGGCDLGPENAAWRYVYGCPGCGREWPRRQSLQGNWSCGDCAPGRYEPSFRMELRRDLDTPWRRLQRRTGWIDVALNEGRNEPPLRQGVPVPLPRRC